jgi:hypothetical protein
MNEKLERIRMDIVVARSWVETENTTKNVSQNTLLADISISDLTNKKAEY